MNRKDMTVLEHITELRKRLIIVLVFFVIALIVGLFTAEPMIKVLQHAFIAKDLTMNAFRITDPMKIYIQMSFAIACILTSPVLLYQLWAFISPGLYEKERKVTLSYIPVAVLLFLLGLAFSYFVLFPYVLRFMTNLSEKLGIHQVIGINEYFRFLFQLTIPFGLLFELPMVVMFLTRLGLVTPMFLAKIRRYAYFVLLVIAGIITPPDVLSQLIVTIPLCFLYEVSIWISRISYKKMLRAERERIEKTADGS